MSNVVRSQPYRLDPSADLPDPLPQLVTNADEMFQILFEDVKALADALNVDEATLTTLLASVSTLSVTPSRPGPPGIDGRDGEENLWPWGGAGSTTSAAVDHQWSVLTNGDVTTPELIFAGGDVIMLET